MGTNLDPRITNPRRRYDADRGAKGGAHRMYRDPKAQSNWDKNALELFGESPNLRKKQSNDE